MPRLKLLFCLLILVQTLGLTQAQSGAWTAWLFNQRDGRMTQVDASGKVLSDLTLPLPPGFDRYPRRVAVGYGGAPFAYVVSNSATFQGQLVIANGGQLTAAFNLPLTIADSFEFVASETNFSADNAAVALGYSLQGGGWGIWVFDTRTGGVIYTLRHDTPLVAVLGLAATPGLTPIVRRFNGREVTFMLVQTGTEGASQYDSYTWTLDSNQLAQNFALISLDSDVLPTTGEIIMSLADPKLPNQSATFTFYQANTLHVYEPTSGLRQAFYNLPNASLFWPRFIQNGERILFAASAANNPTEQWTVIERNASFVGALPAGTTVNDVRGVPTGFIYLTDKFTPGATALLYVDTRGPLNAGVPLWTSAPGAGPVIAWAGGETLAAQTAVTPWAKLGEATYEFATAAQSAPQTTLVAPSALSAITPTPLIAVAADVPIVTPVIGKSLSPGARARVSTTGGDKLNVRLTPNTGADILGKLSNGDRVVVLQGPNRADGYTWWKVRAFNGLEGWVVESVEDQGIRLQTLVAE